MSEVTIDSMVERWTSSSRPLFKGKLISEDNFCCAQGDVLVCSGRTFDDLRSMKQSEADNEVAKILGIPLAQAVLLRIVNDRHDGCPQDVLSNPEKILGPEAHRILNFWAKLDRMTAAALAAAGATAWAAARTEACGKAWAAIEDACRAADEDACRAASWAASWVATWVAARATNEIQAHTKLDRLFFLPMFGIHKIEDLN